MSFVRKYAWYGSAVAASLVLAIALLVLGPAKKADATITIVGFQANASPQAVVALANSDWNVHFTTTNTAVATAITLTLPTGFAITGAVVVQDPNGDTNGEIRAGGTDDVAAVVTTNVALRQVIVTIASTNLGAGTNRFRIVSGVTNPAVAGSYAGLSITTNAAGQVATAGGAVSITTLDLETSASSLRVAADGVATTTIVHTLFGPGTGSLSNSEVFEFSTTLGTFPNGQAVIQVATNANGAVSTTLKSATAGTAIVNGRALDASPAITPVAGNVLFFGAPNATASGSIGIGGTALNATTATVVAGGGAVALSAGFRDASSRTIVGSNVTITTTVGTFLESGTATLSGLTVTSGQLPTATLVLASGAVAGDVSATVTTAVGNLTITGKFFVTGAAGTLTVTKITPLTGNINTAAPNNTAVLRVTVADSAANGLNDLLPVATIATGSLGSISSACTVTAPISGVAGRSVCTYTAPTTAGKHTITLTLGALTGSIELTVAGTPVSMTLTGADTVASGGNARYTAQIKDAGGNVVADATDTVSFAVTGSASGNLVIPSTGVAISGGDANTTFVSGGPSGVFTVTAVGGTTGLTAFKTLTVGTPAPTPPPAGAGTFDRAIPSVGVNTAVYNGGTVEQLSAATAAAGGISVTVFIDGKATVLIPGAPAFVNAAFNAAFPSGTVPAGTIVLVVK